MKPSLPSRIGPLPRNASPNDATPESLPNSKSMELGILAGELVRAFANDDKIR